MKRMRLATLASLVLLLSACGGEPQGAALPPLPKLETLIVKADGVGDGRAWDGVVEAVQQADLTAQTGGRVGSIEVDVNDRVAAGSVLVRLSGIEQKAGADAARAQLRASEAAATEADATYTRYSALASRQLVSRLQLDQVKAARDAAIAARDAARAQVAQAAQQSDYTVVRAPFAGIISARRVEPGESVAPGQPLVSLYQPGALRIEVQVPQSASESIRAAGKARVLLSDGRSVDAATVTVFPAADPLTHSIAVRLALPALDDAPRPGSTAKVVFAITPVVGANPMLQVPRSAIVQRGELSAAYVLDGNRLSLRQLRIGHRLGDNVEVIAGLKSGDVLVLDPVAATQALAKQRKATGAGHE